MLGKLTRQLKLQCTTYKIPQGWIFFG